MKDITLKSLQDSGISKFMSAAELEKTITKSLLDQQQSLGKEQVVEVVKEQTLEDALRDGGLFTYTLGKKKYKLNVLTKDDMNLLDNSCNYLDNGVEYNIQKPYKFHCRNSFDNYVTIKADTYDNAQAVINEIYGKNTFRVSASKL